MNLGDRWFCYLPNHGALESVYPLIEHRFSIRRPPQVSEKNECRKRIHEVFAYYEIHT